MQLFISRYWGFIPETAPIITFSQKAYRDRLLGEAKPHDRIVYVATKGEPAAPEEQGRLLGMAEIGIRAVKTLDVMKREDIPAHNWDGDQPKFPEAIPMLRAWRFTDTPLLTDILQDQLTYFATVAAVKLDEEDTKRILALTHYEVDFPEIEILKQEMIVAKRNALLPSKGVAPSSGERTVNVPERDYGWVYAFRYGKRNAWKVGISHDVDNRLSQLNCNIPHALTGEQWVSFKKQKFASQQDAFDAEQKIIKQLALKAKSLGGEMFECDQKAFDAVWLEVVMNYLRPQQAS